MRFFTHFLFLVLTIGGLTYLVATAVKREFGDTASGSRHSVFFAHSGMSRSDYIAHLKKTMKADDPELYRRIKAVQDRPD